MIDTMKNLTRYVLGICVLALLTSCGGGGSSSGSASLQVAITDLPSSAYSSVTLSIRQIDLMTSTEAGLVNVITLAQPLKVNVLDYNGFALQLGTGVIPADSYRQVRLVLDENPVNGDPLNYVTLNCAELPDEPGCNPDQLWALKTPSGQTSGLKIQLPADLIVHDGDVQRLTLDFDPSTAIVERGDWDPVRHDSKERFLIQPTGIHTLLADVLASYGILTGSVAYADAPTTGPLATVTALEVTTLQPVAATLVDPLADNGATFRFALAAGDYNLQVNAIGYQAVTDGPYTVSESSDEPHPETAAGVITLDPQ